MITNNTSMLHLCTEYQSMCVLYKYNENHQSLFRHQETLTRPLLQFHYLHLKPNPAPLSSTLNAWTFHLGQQILAQCVTRLKSLVSCCNQHPSMLACLDQPALFITVKTFVFLLALGISLISIPVSMPTCFTGDFSWAEDTDNTGVYVIQRRRHSGGVQAQDPEI